jgi:hypothetical protein
MQRYLTESAGEEFKVKGTLFSAKQWAVLNDACS